MVSGPGSSDGITRRARVAACIGHRAARRLGPRAIAICNKCTIRAGRVFATLLACDVHARRCRQERLKYRSSRRIEVKKLIPFIAAAALGLGAASAAQAHVSIGVGIGIPVAPAYPVYAPPPPVYYAPPPPPVYYAPAPAYYAPPPAVVVGGYYGRPYWRHGYGGWGHHGYWRR
ncbi:hypothetical protein BCPG_00815 [Burkholderia cenocepacia PC184]|nr:hypothetical protein BCPG_00815 [Burkholderia cenocepacia PC184]